MVDLSLAERLRAEHRPAMPHPMPSSPLAAIERIAKSLAVQFPHLRGEAEEILSYAAEMRDGGLSRDEVVEAVEEVAGEDLSGCCVSRIADAVVKLDRRGRG